MTLVSLTGLIVTAVPGHVVKEGGLEELDFKPADNREGFSSISPVFCGAVMAKQFDFFVPEAPDILAVHWGWPMTLGVIIAILGLIALWKATTATRLYVRFLGALACLGAFGVLFFSAALAGFWTEFFVHVLWAILLGTVGLIMLLKPDIGAEAITLMIAVYFLISGALTIGFAFSGHVDNFGVYLGEGLINTLLGLILLIGWPISGLWAIGTFIGVDLFLKGAALVAMGLSLRAISEG